MSNKYFYDNEASNKEINQLYIKYTHEIQTDLDKERKRQISKGNSQNGGNLHSEENLHDPKREELNQLDSLLDLLIADNTIYENSPNLKINSSYKICNKIEKYEFAQNFIDKYQ